ncbi:TPA: restriction endonuclease subunit S, partial [Pasteurella multocida]|nr:restriction endonuclease subunit S [Pasteurella multocida]
LLKKLAKYRNGKAHEKNVVESGKYTIVNSKFVSSEGAVRKYTNILIEPLYKDEIAFVLSDVPNGKALAKTYLVDSNGKYSLNQRIAGITPNKETSPYFLNIVMNRNDYFLKFDNGVGQTNLSKSEVEDFTFYCPS